MNLTEPSPVAPRSDHCIAFFWLGCALISAGVLLHLPMLVHAHQMTGNHLAGMDMDAEMYAGTRQIGSEKAISRQQFGGPERNQGSCNRDHKR